MRFAGIAGAPARNEREARKTLITVNFSLERLRACGAFAGEAPAVPEKHIRGLRLQ